MPTFTLREIAYTLSLASQRDRPVSTICCDSRSVEPNALFCALRGARVDGHDFLAEAAAKGATAALVSNSYSGPHHGMDLLRVPEVLQALQDLASAVLQRHDPRIVAVTGSLGKTTTKGFLSVLLAPKFRLAVSPGNSNSQVGLPLAILNHTRGDEELLVLEMAMTQAGQIQQLVSIAPPDVALITSVHLVHAGNFDSLREIGLAKGEILSHPRTRLGVLARDIASFDELSQLGSCRKLSFSTSDRSADYFLTCTEEGLQIAVRGQQRQTLPLIDLKTPHNLHNLLGALTVACELGVGWEELREALPRLTLPERRLETVQLRGITFLNDSYNAALPSIKSALTSLPEPGPGGRKIAVLGPVPELGKFSTEIHDQVGRFALDHVDRLLCVGEECLSLVQVWQQAGRPVLWFPQREPLTLALQQELQAGDVVLLKGANRYQLWKILEAFRSL